MCCCENCSVGAGARSSHNSVYSPVLIVLTPQSPSLNFLQQPAAFHYDTGDHRGRLSVESDPLEWAKNTGFDPAWEDVTD
jgi:hypothetical protein